MAGQTFSRHTNGQRAYKKLLNITGHQGNANQNHNVTSHLLEWVPSKSHKVSDGEDAEKGNPRARAQPLWGAAEPPRDPATPPLGIRLKEMKSPSRRCPHHRVRWQHYLQARSRNDLSVYGGMHKQNVTDTMAYSA